MGTPEEVGRHEGLPHAHPHRPNLFQLGSSIDYIQFKTGVGVGGVALLEGRLGLGVV